MVTDSEVVKKVMGLKTQAENVGREVTRLQTLQETSDGKLTEARQQLEKMGLDPAGDLEAQLAERSQAVAVELTALQQDVVALRQEAGT